MTETGAPFTEMMIWVFSIFGFRGIAGFQLGLSWVGPIVFDGQVLALDDRLLNQSSTCWRLNFQRCPLPVPATMHLWGIMPFAAIRPIQVVVHPRRSAMYLLPTMVAAGGAR